MLLIFDLDGTLFITKPVLKEAARLFCSENHLPVPDESVIYSKPDAFLRAVLPPDSDISSARKRYNMHLYDTVDKHGELYPGTYDTLKTLRDSGHKLVICSASEPEYIRKVLSATGISVFFDAYYSADRMPSKRELIAELFEKNIPAAVIGDSHKDIEAAQYNGLRSVAVMYGYGNKMMLGGADYSAESPADIVDSVRRLAADL